MKFSNSGLYLHVGEAFTFYYAVILRDIFEFPGGNLGINTEQTFCCEITVLTPAPTCHNVSKAM